jgi:polyisoprenyl-teichoic acid--peptidoglycan teichoic acid transferase
VAVLHSALPMSDAPSALEAGSRPHRPWLAALLSFIVPGLGQAYAGRWWLALLLGIPVLLLALVVAGIVTGFIGGLRNSLFANDFLIGVLVVNLVMLAWRSIAIAHAGLTPWERIHGHDRRTTLMVVTGLLVITLGMHAWVGAVIVQLNTTLEQVFGPGEPVVAAPDDGLGDGEGEQPDEPVNEPAFRWDGTDRINALLLGTDAAPGRNTVLTDVLLVVSIDPVARTAVMISVPRDTGFVPLPDESLFEGGLYPDKVNELAANASMDPATWCPDLADDAEACGLRTIERSIGLYLGLQIHHFALVDMAGFADMIDALGGLELCLPGRLVDREFDGSLTNRQSNDGLVLPAGCRAYNGLDALAYARSRKGWIEMPDGERVPQTDFDRIERQQSVLLAMRRELTEADTFLELPSLLRAIGRTVSSDFPRERAGDLASLMPLIAGPDIERVVLGHPDFVDLPTEPDVNYLLIPNRDAIRQEMARLFGLGNLQGWYLGSTAPGPTGDPAADAPIPPTTP